MKIISIITIVLFAGLSVSAQKYFTKNGHIKFYSKAQMETISANNHQVNSALDVKAGDFVFKVLMKAFEFEKALMQEHFNENYVESDKFPNATFKGTIDNMEEINFDIKGEYDVVVKGELTIHGVTKQISRDGILEIKGDKITAKSKFNILLEDYDIKIPNTVVNNISETIEITVDVEMEECKK